MNRLLKIVDFCYGEATRQRVFEPLLADRDSEVRGNRSLLTRLRWWSAVGTTFVACLPRATFGDLSAMFVFDVALRAVAFFAVSFGLQWLMAFRHSTAAWPPSFTTSIFFIITPVILRIRYESITQSQQRLLVLAFSTTCLAIAVISLSPSTGLAAALFMATAWLMLFSWKLYAYLSDETKPARSFMAAIYPATAVGVAFIPVKLALGIGLLQPLWPGDNLTAYIVGALVAMTAKGVELPEAPYRRFLK